VLLDGRIGVFGITAIDLFHKADYAIGNETRSAHFQISLSTQLLLLPRMAANAMINWCGTSDRKGPMVGWRSLAH
jgi:hypothetical protein